MFEKITILAPGLLGASLAMALKSRGLAKSISIWARRPEVRIRCARETWCDSVQDQPEKAVEGASLIVICSPVDTIIRLAKRIAPHLSRDSIVTDVGSTKSLICRHAQAAMPEDRNCVFVGSHPMAGSEKSGMAHASSDLFDNLPCFVTPLVDTPDQAIQKVVQLWNELDMDVTTVSPEVHDEIVAGISHLPHIIAATLCTCLSTCNHNWINYAGNGLKDTTRIASGNPGVWKEIINQNKEEIVRIIDRFEGELQQFKSALVNGQSLEILNILKRAKAYRNHMRPDIEPN